MYGPSRAMDYELEIGVIVGKSVPALQGLKAKDADEHIFGMVILNDWSCEYCPPVTLYIAETLIRFSQPGISKCARWSLWAR